MATLGDPNANAEFYCFTQRRKEPTPDTLGLGKVKRPEYASVDPDTVQQQDEGKLAKIRKFLGIK